MSSPSLRLVGLHLARPGWQTGSHYLKQGFRIVRVNPRPYIQTLILLAIPAVVAALITVSVLPEGLGKSVAIFMLNGISATFAPPIIMVAVAAGFRGENLSLRESIRDGAIWIPRYIWTNLHTTPIFWVPVTLLVTLMQWSTKHVPITGAAGTALLVMWVTLIAIVALYVHMRTLLAPFFAVHGNMPGTLATIESWRMSGQHSIKTFGTMVVSSAPAAIPSSALILGLYFALASVPEARAALIAMLPSLVWVFIKLVRPFLIPATYLLYQDLWEVEISRRARDGHPNIPALARPLLRLSGWIPRLAGSLVGRKIDWTL